MILTTLINNNFSNKSFIIPIYSAVVLSNNEEMLKDMTSKLLINYDRYPDGNWYGPLWAKNVHNINHLSSPKKIDFPLVPLRSILGINQGRHGGVRNYYTKQHYSMGTLLLSPTNYKFIPPQIGHVVKKDVRESIYRFFEREINEL